MQTHGAEQRREQAHRIIEHLRNIESAAQSLGSYARHYVSSANEASLQSYNTTEASLRHLLEALAEQFRADSQQQIYLNDLQNLVASRLAWERKLLSINQNEGKAQALAFVETLGGATTMDNIRTQLRVIENTERLQLIKYSADYELYRWVSLVAILLLTMTGGFALWHAIKVSSRSARLEADQVLTYEHLDQMNKRLNTQVSELLKAQEDANNALMVRSQFLARVSHELRTPLCGIISATELALEQSPGKAVKELIEIANQSGNILLELVNGILDFENLEQQHLQLEAAAFDLPLAIKSVLEPLRMRAQKKGISFHVDITSQTPHLVFSDRLRIQQVLGNLVDNATKFTDRGDVRISVAAEKKTSTSAVVCFTISDTGIGINANVLDQIWEPFMQGDGSSTRKYGGSGLGLSISKKLVELLDGEIGVISSPGQGSEFFFKVPVDLTESPVVVS